MEFQQKHLLLITSRLPLRLSLVYYPYPIDLQNKLRSYGEESTGWQMDTYVLNFHNFALDKKTKGSVKRRGRDSHATTSSSMILWNLRFLFDKKN